MCNSIDSVISVSQNNFQNMIIACDYHEYELIVALLSFQLSVGKCLIQPFDHFFNE